MSIAFATSTPSNESITADYFPPDEGQLSVDIFRDQDVLIIRSAVAGVNPADIDVVVHDDLLTVRGKREMRETVNADDWFLHECYWGSFSRSIILPTDVFTEQATASLTNGLLEIRIPIREAMRHLDIIPVLTR